MTNPAFDAAMLLRGLRAMDAALGETYSVLSHTCIPEKVNYPNLFPETGIDFSKYQGGFEGLKGVWRGWMYEDAGKGKLKETVHPDVEETVIEAFSIVTKCDKSKDGIITKAEWEECQKGKKANDQLFDLEYIVALNNVSAKMVTLEKDQPLNPADPNTYPELIDARNTIKDKESAISSLTIKAQKSQEEAELYQKLSIGLGSGLGLLALALGIRMLLRRKPTPPASPTPQENAPKNPQGGGSGTTVGPKVEVTIHNASPAKAEVKTEGNYDDVLNNLDGNSPNDDVLKALAEGDNAKNASVNGFQEIMTYAVNDAAIGHALYKIDPELAGFYRSKISTATSPITTMGDLLARIAIVNPDALSQAQIAVAAEGRPATEMSERIIFELIAKAADWKPADATARSGLVGKFEAEVRAEHGVKTNDAKEAAEKSKAEADESSKEKTKILEKK